MDILPSVGIGEKTHGTSNKRKKPKTVLGSGSVVMGISRDVLGRQRYYTMLCLIWQQFFPVV
jgi:hypothetical protein